MKLGPVRIALWLAAWPAFSSDGGHGAVALLPPIAGRRNLCPAAFTTGMTALIAAAAALLVSAAPLPAGPPLLLGPPLWWRDDGPGGARAEYVFLRKQFVLEEFAPTSASATVEITAQPTWSSVGDAGNLPKLLGAYKLAINGALVAAGPGRSRDGELGVDRIHDVSSLLVVGANVVTVAGFHADDNNTSAGPWMPGASVPGIAFGMRIDTGDAAARNTTTIRTDDSWSAFNAQRVYNPTGNAGCGWYRDPQEYLNTSAMPPHWPSSSEEDVKQQRDDWRAVAVQPAFAQPLKPKATRHIPVLRVAARLTKRGPGHYLIDLGREIQGGAREVAGTELVRPNSRRNGAGTTTRLLWLDAARAGPAAGREQLASLGHRLVQQTHPGPPWTPLRP